VHGIDQGGEPVSGPGSILTTNQGKKVREKIRRNLAASLGRRQKNRANGWHPIRRYLTRRWHRCAGFMPAVALFSLFLFSFLFPVFLP
jgi:hypothetical protein